jgi:uncharacterized protein YceH (UPF0502 family)
MSEEEKESNTILTSIEARVLACLMEKQLTTPHNYPLSINSLTQACNQKSNREPTMKLREGEVGHTVNQLEERELVRIDYSERAHRVSHRMNLAFTLNQKQRAIMTVLMLRLPQTLNDIKTRTQRMDTFDGTEEIEAILNEFSLRKRPLVKCLPKGPGQREERYAQLLCGEVESATTATRPKAVPPLPAVEEDRLTALEERIKALESQVETLWLRLDEPA